MCHLRRITAIFSGVRIFCILIVLITYLLSIISEAPLVKSLKFPPGRLMTVLMDFRCELNVKIFTKDSGGLSSLIAS